MMKRKQFDRSINLTMILATAIVLALALVIVPSRATAQVSCLTAGTTDTDGDGFTPGQKDVSVNGTLNGRALTNVGNFTFSASDTLRLFTPKGK